MKRAAARPRAHEKRIHPTFPREQTESPFFPILRDLVSRVPGALAAALVDFEGEAIDYAGSRIDPYDIRVAAAYWRVVIEEIAARPRLGALRSLIVRGERRSFIVRPLPDGYALVVLLGRRAGFAATMRAFNACSRALSHEASWPAPRESSWFPVEVTCDRRRRPARLAAFFADGTKKRASSVDVLGALVGLAARERGYRVRLDSGIELNLVCEVGGGWYADEEL